MSKIESNGISRPAIENPRKPFVTSELRDTSQELQELREQLAAAQDAADSLNEEANNWERTATKLQIKCNELNAQLAACQAREQQLREVLKRIADLRNLGKIEPEVVAFEALALTSDTTALEAMIQKAGKVMLEMCISISFKQFLSDVHTAAGLLRYGKKDQGLADRLGKGVINYMTQTIPIVTLNDLK